MPLTLFPQAKSLFKVQKFEEPGDPARFLRTHVPFSGAPRQHPYDKKTKVILVIDPGSSSTSYVEFKIADIARVEELANIVTPWGVTIPMVRIWVKKKSIATRCTPFVVEDTSGA